MAKSVDDRVVAATVHGLIAAANEYVGGPYTAEAEKFANRAIELIQRYLNGEEIDDIRMDANWTSGTVEMLKTQFTVPEQN